MEIESMSNKLMRGKKKRAQKTLKAFVKRHMKKNNSQIQFDWIENTKNCAYVKKERIMNSTPIR